MRPQETWLKLPPEKAVDGAKGGKGGAQPSSSAPAPAPKRSGALSPYEQRRLAQEAAARFADRIKVRVDFLQRRRITCVCDPENGDVTELTGTEDASFDLKILRDHPTIRRLDFAGCYGMHGKTPDNRVRSAVLAYKLRLSCLAAPSNDAPNVTLQFPGRE